jgi:hypothetical protein
LPRGVFGVLSSGSWYSLVAAKLFLPKSWVNDRERCLAAGIPDSKIVFKTKLDLAYDIVSELLKKCIRFDWVVADGFYGHDHKLRSLLNDLGVKYMLDIHDNLHVFLTQPNFTFSEKTDCEEVVPTKPKSDIEAHSVKDIISTVSEASWKTFPVRKTSKGQLVLDIYVQEVFTWDEQNAVTRKELLVVSRKKVKKQVKQKKLKGSKKEKKQQAKELKRKDKKEAAAIKEPQSGEPNVLMPVVSVDTVPTVLQAEAEWEYEYKFSLVNVAAKAYSWLQLAQAQAQRFYIEQTFRDAKKEIGLSEYQVRGWQAWHHHVALVMLAMQFVLDEKMAFEESYPLLTAGDIRKIITDEYPRNRDVRESLRKRHKRRAADILNAGRRRQV